MEPLLNFTRQMEYLKTTLTQVQDNATQLQADVENLETNLTALVREISGNITNSCSTTECNATAAKVSNTTVAVNYSSIETDYNPLIQLLDDAVASGLSKTLQEGYDNFTEIVDKVDLAVGDEIAKARVEVNEVVNDISEELDDVAGDLEEIGFRDMAKDLRDVSAEDTQLPAEITFWSMVGVSSVLALIVLLTFFGLICGCCPRAKTEKDFCGTRKVGATFLLAGVGLTFLFYWIFLLVLLPTFLIGGLTHTEICRHVVALDESPINGIFDEMFNAAFADDLGYTVNITQIYSSCRENDAFYTALNAEETFDFDINALLDTTEITKQIDTIMGIEIDIGHIEIVDDKTLGILEGLGSELHNTSTKTKDNIAELSNPVTTENLLELADEIRGLNENALYPWATELERLYNSSVIPIDSQRIATKYLLEDAQSLLSVNVTGIAVGLEDGQTITTTEGDTIIEGAIDEAATHVEVLINTSVAEIENNVKENIGRCRPVYNAVATMTDAGCVELLYAVNGYWFALGWSVFFLLISVILSFKLSTLYRKTLDHDAPEPREDAGRGRREGQRAARPIPQPRSRGNDTTVLILRSDSHEMMPVNNPVYAVEENRIPRPRLKSGVNVYPHEMTAFAREPPRYTNPPSYAESQGHRKQSKKLFV